MSDGGYIRLFRSMRDWEWYGDEAATTLFLHLLLNANFRPGRFRGKEVLPGQMVTSMERIREALGWSRGKVRHTLEKLRSSGDITIQTTNHWTTLTLVSWVKYQDGVPVYNQPNSQPTTDRQPSEQPTNNRPLATIEEEQEEQEGKKEKKKGALPLSSKKEEPMNLPFSSPTYVATWEAFEKMRKKIPRAPWTNYARKLTIEKLATMSERDGIRALENAIEGSWRTVFPPKTSATDLRKRTEPNQDEPITLGQKHRQAS